MTSLLRDKIQEMYRPQNSPDCKCDIEMGFNTENENLYGMMLYHRNRLIRPYHRLAQPSCLFLPMCELCLLQKSAHVLDSAAHAYLRQCAGCACCKCPLLFRSVQSVLFEKDMQNVVAADVSDGAVHAVLRKCAVCACCRTVLLAGV